MCLIYLFTSPILLCYSAIPLGMSDLIATIVFFVLLAIETIADNQMWEFQCKKAEQLKTEGKLQHPFEIGRAHV